MICIIRQNGGRGLHLVGVGSNITIALQYKSYGAQIEACTCPKGLVNTCYLFNISEYYNTVPTSSLFDLDLRLLYTTVHRQLFCVRSYHATSSRLIVLLLLLGGIETSPGPFNGRCNGLHLGYINVRSAVNKSSIIQDIISSSRLDVLAICETWYNSDIPPAIVEGTVPKGYSVHYEFCELGRAGRCFSYLQVVPWAPSIEWFS